MGKKWKDEMAKLGPMGNLRESLKLISNHAKPFLLIQLTLVQPCVIMMEALAFIVPQIMSRTLPPSHRSADATSSYEFNSRQEYVYNSQERYSFAGSSQRPFLQSLAINFASMQIIHGPRVLWISANLYAVGLIYTGKTVSFTDVLLAIRRLWKRLLVTALWFFFFVYFNEWLHDGLDWLFLTKFHLAEDWLPVLVFAIAEIYAGRICILADGVSILEESYGWAAVKKAMQLLQGRIWVAIGAVFLLAPAEVIPFALHRVLQTKDPWSPTFFPLGVLYIVVQSLVFQFTNLSGGVLYVSLKAYHNESIADSSFFKELTKEVLPCEMRTDAREIDKDNTSITVTKNQQAEVFNFV